MLSREPAVENYPYGGWIPTVNGHLSFRHIGETRHPTESFYANVTLQRRRMVLCVQRRPLSDVLFQWAIRILARVYLVSKRNGEFWFVLAVTSDGGPGEAEEIKGTVYIYKSKSDWNRYAAEVEGSVEELNELRLSLDDDRDVRLAAAFDRANSCLAASADMAVELELNRGGEIFFGRPVFRDRELEEDSANYAKTSRHDLHLWVANQTYAFMRDVCHRHQHHIPTSDTILLLQERQQGDRVSWRRNIIYSLQHYIIRAKRFGDGEALAQSAGVLAYCMSFQSICRRQLGDQADRLPVYNDTALLQSLDARSREQGIVAADASSRAAITIAKAGNRRSYALIIAGIVVAFMAMLLQPRVSPAPVPHLDALSNFAAEYSGPIFIAVILLCVIVWMVTANSPRASHRLARDTLELANVNRARSILISVVVTGLLALTTVAVAQTAIVDFWSVVAKILRGLI